MGGARDDDDSEPETVGMRRRTPAAPVAPPADCPPPADGDWAESLPAGTTAGRYVVLSRLGAGGAGLVYAAYDPVLDRKVALKLLRTGDDEEHAASRGRERLLREGQAMARLKHPNVLPVYDVGTLDHPRGSRVFMAMELVEGGTLRAWLKLRHSRREILDVMIACGRGLAAAHAAGFVHRDFKPDNVLVDRDGRVFVTDFGLVRAAGASDNDARPSPQPPSALESPLTDVDTVLGTPGYMAPEQYQAQPADERSDQFSFCVTLCEALCGRKIFVGRSMQELEAATLGGAPVEALRQAKVPSWLGRVVLRGLSRQRESRFPTMNELLAALAANPMQRVRRVGVALAAVAAIGGTAAGVHRLSVHQQALCSGAERQLSGIWDAAARERVRQAFNRANVRSLFEPVAGALDSYAAELVAQHREACEATRVRGEQPESLLGLRMSCLDARRKELAALSSLLADADRATAFAAVETAAKLTSIRSCGDVAALTARIPPPSDPDARRRVEALRAKLAEAKVLVDVAQYAKARPIVDDVLRAEAALHYGPLRAEALEQLARLQREQDGNMKAVEASLNEAIAVAYASHDDARVAASMTDLANLESYWLDQHQEGERWVSLARAPIERLGGSDELEAERARIEAEILIGEEEGAKAVAAAAPALRLAEKVYGPASLQAAQFHATLGGAESTNGNTANARAHYRAQYDILVHVVGSEHPLVAMALNNLGLNDEAEGRLADAERDYRASVSLLEKTLGPDHPRVAIALANLGSTLRLRQKYAEALAVFERSLAINERHFGPDYGDSLDALLGIGESLVALGRPAEARPSIERALRVAQAAEQHWGVAEARFALAEALWATGSDRARARKLAAEARVGMAAETNSLARGQLVEIDRWIDQHR